MWNDERIEQLRTLWSEGLSCNEIANRIDGVTRNAVIGKAHRMGLPGRAPRKNFLPRKPVSRIRTAKAAKTAAKRWPIHTLGGSTSLAPPMAPTALPDPTAFDNERLASGSVTLLDLEPHHCRWPVGTTDLANHRFCGCTPVEGLPYCEVHAARAFAPPTVARPYLSDQPRMKQLVRGDQYKLDNAAELLEPA
jgi:GcrA cell cycle regulator